MKSPEVSPKAFASWVATAMLGPVALASAKASWIAVLVSAIVCSVLSYVVYSLSSGGAAFGKAYCLASGLWNLYAVAAVAAQAGICWPGKGSQIVVPLVLIALAAISSYRGAHKASAVAATIMPLCVIIFAVVLACGIGNVRWNRLDFSTAAPGGTLIFVFLLPVAAVTIPRRHGTRVEGALLAASCFAVLVSIVVVGTLSLPVALTREDAFYEFSKSLNLFSVVQRFEAVVAVAVTLSAYSMLSLLLSASGAMAQCLFPRAGRWIVPLGAAASAGIVVLKLWIDGRIAALISLLVWGIMAAIGARISAKKLVKNQENST